MQLRDYQEQAVNEIRDQIRNGHKKILLVLPTGAGKSHTMGDITYKAIENGHKILSLMHRRQLVTQLTKIFEECGINSSMIMSGEDSNLGCKSQIATCQTYVRRLKIDSIENNPFFVDASIVFIDEAHHVLSNTYQKILSNYKDKIVIGVTATPILASGVGMGKYFDVIVNPIQIHELIDQKFLVPGVYYGPSTPDLSKLKTMAGDYEKKGLNKLMNQPKLIGDVVENWLKIAGGLSTMVFAVKVDHSKALCQAFIDKGVSAEHLDAHAPDEVREETLWRFRNGDTQIICNVGLYTEGTDIPEIECIVLARPTKSLGLHLQMIGRGARPNKGKDQFTVLDHGGNIDRLGFYEDEIEWNLSGKEPGAKKKIVRKEEKKIRTCEECNFLFIGPTCPQCGKTIKGYGKMIEAEEAELVELGKNRKKATMQEKLRFMQMAEYHRKMKGYAPGWASHLFRSKFSVWPNRFKDVSPIEPDKGFKNYLTHRAIAYHKGKQRGIKQ